MTLVHAMAANDIVKKCISAWAALVVLAPKANQEAIPWHEYIWRLCLSYRHLNQVTCPYAYPMPRCDDAVDEIPPGMMFFLFHLISRPATGKSLLPPPPNTNWLFTRRRASTLSNVCQWVPSTQPPFL
jgi:hypothetical protein